MKKVFIHTNNMQGLGAKLAKYSIERFLPTGTDITVHVINVDNIQAFKDFAGKTYTRGGRLMSYNPKDLQSFTLSRFMPPEEMGFVGRSIVIDPDIFALTDITPLMNMDLEGNALAACPKKDAWDTSCMVMDNAKLTDWKIKDILGKLERKEMDYIDIMSLRRQDHIKELSREWNSLDVITEATKMLHTTNRITQPWSTGLPIDFTMNPMPKILGIIPREPIHKLLGKYPSHYLPHPDKKVESFFLTLCRDALKAGAITEADARHELDAGRLRKDFFEKIKMVAKTQ